ncbi:hypothetical protein QAD02_010467 [Eretmocerus hayati]|uniref:Uncharacterized protein n=1 Tax=Eretmocerus hayati TaxID=131215 RepID=A0ACC2NVR0_9HYME|nr:hypothetical protein QAD02_010467 [Eretmocerus hayati]
MMHHRHRQEAAQMGHVAQHPPSQHVHHNKMQASSSRILLDVPCKVCRDHSSGKHYGIYACDGCAGFFKRSIRRNRQYACKAKAEGGCMVDKTHRNQCRACRLSKCIQAGMNRDAVQHERGPRNSTLRRQMALYYGGKDHDIVTTMVPPPNAALDLVLPKPSVPEPKTSLATPIAHHPVPLPVYTNISISKLAAASQQQQPVVAAPAPPAPTATLPLRAPYWSVPDSFGMASSMCEMAAQLLLLSVRWARDLNLHSGLCEEDQLTVLESSWRELFLLSAAQYAPYLDPTALLPAGPAGVGLALEAARFRETLLAFNALGLDSHEYSYVSAVVLYKAGLDCDSSAMHAPCSSRSSNGSCSPQGGPTNQQPRLRDAASVVRLRDSAQQALGARMAATSSFGALRFSKLILMLPMLRTVSASAIEDFFFRRAIRDCNMESIIYNAYYGKS